MTTLPTITGPGNLYSNLKLWQQTINPVVNAPRPPRSPFNFSAKSVAATTGILLSWELVKGADGYKIYFSDNGDFSSHSQLLIQITNVAQTNYFDNIGVTGQKRWYRISATTGTANAPQSVEGTQSAPISNSTGSGTTSQDNTSHTSGSGGWNKTRVGQDVGF